MKLENVYDLSESAQVLYDLLSEREQHQNISHKEMPSWAMHCSHYASRPYEAWYLIIDDSNSGERAPRTVGAIYLSKHREVGLFIFRDYHSRGFGRRALADLRLRHPGKILANIAIYNKRSQRFFESQGFALYSTTPDVQHTYVWEEAALAA
jgi:RimJ/RimL family protein N-acetyltransferase